jgi:hypothetical protein
VEPEPGKGRKGQRQMVLAMITAFAQDTYEAASQQWRTQSYSLFGTAKL